MSATTTNGKLLLVRAITLLYRESQLEGAATTSSPEIVKDVVNSVLTPDADTGVENSERNIIIGLKTLANMMATNPPGTKYVSSDIFQKVRVFCEDNDAVYQALRDGLEGEMSDADLRVITTSIRQELNAFIREQEALKIIREFSRKAAYDREEITDINSFIAEFRSKLEMYESSQVEKDPAIVGEVNLTDIDHVAQIFRQAQELNDERGIMRTGWQGINRMLQGGLRRGEEVVIGALQHNFKTGFTLSLFKHIAMYNTPYMLDEKKKPLLIRISLEDPLSLNFPFLYRNIKENQTLEQADVSKEDPEAMARFVVENLQINGYEICMLHVNPSQWGYRDLQNFVLSKEAEGYEIHLLMVDYLNMLDKRGLDNSGPTGSNIRDLFRRMRNFCAPRKITLVTPHQLSTEAKMLIRQGAEETFVKEIANKGYYDSCKTIDQEVDLELYIHKVIADGKSWLCVQRGKHRLIKQTPEEYKYIVLPFYDIGDLREDINGPDMSRKKPAGAAQGEAKPFWDFDPE